MKLRFDESDIQHLACWYEKEECSELEIELMSFEQEIKKREHLCKDELVKVAK